MHCAIPTLPREMSRVLSLGAGSVELAGGRLLARGMTLVLRLGFGYLLRDGLVNADESAKALAFFRESFEIVDPVDPEKKSYYQGRFLIRTRKRGDDLNVLLRFCPDPDQLFRSTPFGRGLDPAAVVASETLSERRADRIESDPSRIDLVIRFRDAETILGLLRRPDADPTALMLENVVQVSGDLGHLFKLGAIAASIDRQIRV